MKLRPAGVLRSALAHVSVRVVLAQMALGLAVFLLFVLWLHVPDASGLDVAGSVVLGLALLALAGGGESALMLRLAGRKPGRGLLLRGSLLLLMGVALWIGWCALVDGWRGKEYLWAGYLSSQMPHGLRYFFRYDRVLAWLGWMWTLVEWAAAGVLAMVVFACTVSTRPVRAMLVTVRSAGWWLTLLGCLVVGTAATTTILDWMPGHGLRVETLSLVLRLGSVIVLDAWVVCVVLAALGVCARRADDGTAVVQSTPEGTSDLSQPRTTANP